MTHVELTEIPLSTEAPRASGDEHVQDRWLWQTTARRIPRHAVADLQRMAEVIAEANSILQRAHDESQAMRQKAYVQGMQAAQAAIASAIAEALVRVQQEAKICHDAAEPRVVQLVFAVLRRILPQLSPDLVLESVVEEALRAVHERHYVRVCVNPDVESTAQVHVDQWRQKFPEIQHLEIATDDRLAATECRVESPYGHVNVSMHDRFEKIVRAYEQTLVHQQKNTPAHD